MVSSVCSPSIDSSFFISVKSNQNIACPFQIKRNYLSGPWKLPGILSVAEQILWAIFLHWEHVQALSSCGASVPFPDPQGS